MEMEHEIPYFTSLGMFIIDEISFPNLKLDGILGGGGTFAACGSIMVLGSKESQKCAWFVDIGNDCPPDILKELKSWNSGGVFRYDNSRRCTRGWNGYGKNEFREFKYLTPKKRITIDDLEEHPWMLQSKSFHFVCSPKRCTELLKDLDELSSQHATVRNGAVIAWEPIPDCCKPEFLQDTLRILPKVDVLTPNAAECASFFGEEEPLDRQNCERIAFKFLDYLTKPDSGIVLRCGGLGCLLIKSVEKTPRWFPAYHKKSDDETFNKVIDPTGCGNTFVGAFATAFVKYKKNFELGCIYATLASGACIEQYGLPKVTKSDKGQDLWNGTSIADRLDTYVGHYPELRQYSAC